MCDIAEEKLHFVIRFDNVWKYHLSVTECAKVGVLLSLMNFVEVEQNISCTAKFQRGSNKYHSGWDPMFVVRLLQLQ